MECVVAEDVTRNDRALVPSELVFLPFRPHTRFKGTFGSSSNGLASGNTLREAVVHGLSELIERDIRSFEAVRDTSAPVDLDSATGAPAALVEAIRAAGLELYVRTVKNDFGVAYFTAVINDPDACVPQLLNGGFGCHPHRSVAFVRAVAEAAQSRLSFIHGGRDDLIDTHTRFRGWSQQRKRGFVQRVVEQAKRGESVPLSSVDDHSETITTVEECESFLLHRLHALGFDRVYQIAFCRPEDDLQVVRVIVPRLELFNESLFRVGPRLRDCAEAA
jgi:ribosomal protein S12 methylthiotransferase accessory factor